MRVPVVDEEDNIIEYKEKHDLLPTDRNRDTGLFIFNEKGEILLGKRSSNKKLFPNRWAIAVAGTVEEGESYEENMTKEAKEEVGLVDIKPIFLFKCMKDNVVKRMSAIFKVTVPNDYNFKIEPNEISEIKWVSTQELEHLLKTQEQAFTPNFAYTYFKFKEHENQS